MIDSNLTVKYRCIKTPKTCREMTINLGKLQFPTSQNILYQSDKTNERNTKGSIMRRVISIFFFYEMCFSTKERVQNMMRQFHELSNLQPITSNVEWQKNGKQMEMSQCYRRRTTSAAAAQINDLCWFIW